MYLYKFVEMNMDKKRKVLVFIYYLGRNEKKII